MLLMSTMKSESARVHLTPNSITMGQFKEAVLNQKS
jgi:hypothetical protein